MKYFNAYLNYFAIVLAISFSSISPVQAYTVKSGDTLTKIATDFKTTVKTLVRINSIKNPDRILVGQTIDTEPSLYSPEILGAGYNPVTAYQSRTTAYISSSATTIPVASTKDKAGVQIDLTNISASGTVKVYLNLEPGTTREEPIVCTGITATSWTNCTRGLTFQGSGETTSSTISVAHNAGSSIILTNIAQFFNQYVAVDGTQQVNGVKTFTSYPVFSPATTIPTTNGQFATKYYVDSVGAGGFTSLNVGKGLQALGTSPEKVAFNPAATSTSGLGFVGSAATVVTSTNGGITANNDGLVLNTSSTINWQSPWTFSSTTSFTGTTSTFSGVTQLTNMTAASSTITVLNVQNVSTTKDITINGLDGNTLATASTTDATDYHYHKALPAIGQFTRVINSTGSQVVTHDLGVSPSHIQIYCVAATDDAGAASWTSSLGEYNAASSLGVTSQYSTYFAIRNTANTAQLGQSSTNIISLIDGGGGNDAIGNLSAVAANTFTVNWSTNVNAGGTRQCQYSVWK